MEILSKPNEPASFPRLPAELLWHILSYLAPPHPIEAPSHLGALRLVCRTLSDLVTPLYWSLYVPQIEAWGFDGIEDQHPTLATPTNNIQRIFESLRSNLIKIDGKVLGGEKFLERKKAIEWTSSERYCYRVDEEGKARLRNMAWLKEIPEGARLGIRSVWVHGEKPLWPSITEWKEIKLMCGQKTGPVPGQAGASEAPPPRSLDKMPADFWAPLLEILKWYVKSHIPSKCSNSATLLSCNGLSNHPGLGSPPTSLL
jgi:hypothetical protein